MASTNPLPPGPRGIRRVHAPDAPWDGALAQTADGARCLLVDADRITDAISTHAGASEHLATVSDLVRTRDGHLAVLPMCTQPLVAFAARRGAGPTPLSPGETVTIAVSIIRGLAELNAAEVVDECGRWWLGDGGRPLLVGGGEQSVQDASAAVLEELPHEPATDAALQLAAEVIAEPRRLQREAQAVEAALFTAAEAEPLATAVFAPRHARQVAVSDETEAVPPPRGSLWERLSAHVDAGAAELVSRAATAVWRRLRADRPRHRARRPVAVAAGVAAVVVAVGMLWPQGADDAATAQPRHPSPTVARPSGTPHPAATTGAGRSEGEGGGLVNATAELLEQWTACTDASCRARVQEDPAAQFTGAVTAADRRSVTLLDDYGGAAVLRADADAGRSWLVVIVRKNGRWLLRDIRDVAEQPKR